MTAEKKEAMKFFPSQPISIGENTHNPMKRNRWTDATHDNSR
jgi:hypothetical protein